MQIIGNRQDKPLKPRIITTATRLARCIGRIACLLEKRDPETKKSLANPENYACFQINLQDNAENISAGYLETLQNLSSRLQKRFLKGEFADANPNALFHEEDIDKWRSLDGKQPDFVRVVVAVDPSGSGVWITPITTQSALRGLCARVDGMRPYLLFDCTVKAGPATWGKVAADAYETITLPM